MKDTGDFMLTLAEPPRSSERGDPALREILERFEKSLLLVALAAAEGSQKRAATALGVLPSTLQEKLKRFGIVRRQSGRKPRHALVTLRSNGHHSPQLEAPSTLTEEQP